MIHTFGNLIALDIQIYCNILTDLSIREIHLYKIISSQVPI